MGKPEILNLKNIKLNQKSVDKIDAIIASGALLVDSGYVKEAYVDSMIKRDENLSVYLGSALAIPHGEYNAKEHILHSGISVLIYPDGIDWDGDEVKVVIGLAGVDDEHIEILSNLAIIFSEEENIDDILNAKDVQIIYDLLSKEA